MEERKLRKENLNQLITIFYILFLRLCNKKGKHKDNVDKDFSIRVVTDAKIRSKGGKCKIRCTTGMESISYI